MEVERCCVFPYIESFVISENFVSIKDIGFATIGEVELIGDRSLRRVPLRLTTLWEQLENAVST